MSEKLKKSNFEEYSKELIDIFTTVQFLGEKEKNLERCIDKIIENYDKRDSYEMPSGEIQYAFEEDFNQWNFELIYTGDNKICIDIFCTPFELKLNNGVYKKNKVLTIPGKYIKEVMEKNRI